jgi:hypothetical protein
MSYSNTSEDYSAISLIVHSQGAHFPGVTILDSISIMNKGCGSHMGNKWSQASILASVYREWHLDQGTCHATKDVWHGNE